ncbi:MAG: Hsp20/alpha crystallin family protein [Bacteroidota bacterium]
MSYYRRRRPAYRKAGYRRPKHNVPVNISEYPDRFEAKVYALGFAKEDISITISDDVMYISGHRKPVDEYPPFILQEYPIKSFERSFELSDHADQDRVSAKMDDGAVLITVMKTSASQKPDVEVDIV